MPSIDVGCFQIVYWGDMNKPDNPRDPKALAYFAAVKRELDNVGRSHAGRILMNSLTFHKKRIIIMHPAENQCNAVESKLNDNESSILFSPDYLTTCSAKLAANDRSATLPHERLHHELFHSLRRISNKNAPHRLSGQRLPSFGDSEEFLAILVTNIFISDVTNKHKTSMRGSWNNHPMLEHEHDESFTFFSLDTGVYNIVLNFCDDNRGYTSMLAQVRASFNPIAAIIKNPRKCFEISASAMEDEAWDKFWVDHLVKGMVPLNPPPAGPKSPSS